MLGKAGDLKVHSLSWWATLEIGKPSLQDLLQNWLAKHPDLHIMQITFELHQTHKQALIIYKEESK